MVARIFVTLRPGIHDPQGQSVARALQSMGFDEVLDARVGKLIEVDLPDVVGVAGGDQQVTQRQRVAQMCEKLLANPVIETATFELAKARAASAS